MLRNLTYVSLIAIAACRASDAASRGKVNAPAAMSLRAMIPLSRVLSEGDSISVFWGGNHTGIYARTHANVAFYPRAVGGSTLASLLNRQAADLAVRPNVLTVLIGANDLYRIGLPWFKYRTPQAYLQTLFAYVAPFRAGGAKVAVGTVLPQCTSGDPHKGADRATNTNRVPVNIGLRAAVGSKIDAVIDFAADPAMGPDGAACDLKLYTGGLHPTDGRVGGQGKMEVIYAVVVDALLSP